MVITGLVGFSYGSELGGSNSSSILLGRVLVSAGSQAVAPCEMSGGGGSGSLRVPIRNNIRENARGVRSSFSSVQSPLSGCTRQLRGGTELDLDSLAIRLDGVNAPIKLVSNLGRGLPFTDPLEDVKLAVREDPSRQEGRPCLLL